MHTEKESLGLLGGGETRKRGGEGASWFNLHNPTVISGVSLVMALVITLVIVGTNTNVTNTLTSKTVSFTHSSLV